MSFRECIQVYCRLDILQYLTLLQAEYGARPHPRDAGSFLIDAPEIPFFHPEPLADHTSILGFNYTPLSSLLIMAMIEHPELAPRETIVCRTAEQELLVWGTLVALAQRFDASEAELLGDTGLRFFERSIERVTS